MQDLEIRRATPEDIPSVKRLEDASFGVGSYTYSFFRQSIELFDDSFLIARGETGLLGYVLAARIPNRPDTGWILSVGVHPTQRRRGIASQLTNRILVLFRSQQVQAVKLSVAPDNQPALRLYERLGFETTRLKNDYFGAGVHRVIMEKQL